MEVRNWIWAAFLALPSVASASSLPMDTPVRMGNVEAVCTGIGEGKNDPRWHTYPIRVEFADSAAHYLAGAHVSVSDVAGTELAQFDCSGAWVLLNLPRGLYTVNAKLSAIIAAPASAKFQPPQTGQTRVVLRFAVAGQ
jgi:hypothetical protein